MANTFALPTLRKPAALLMQANLGIPLLLLALLCMMILPVPPLVLDILFTFNIALSMVGVLVAVYALRPREFALFPTVLLVATLMRLALNVASTRVVLLDGHNGTAAAGHVIESFGAVLVGGNYVGGLVVFIIFVIINFVVVTKGAGRVSEVSARFTLDAMPGKQMAIDADLNAGLITQEDARIRREEVGREADFYGAMDGASKFVRGDAVAGILIMFINVIGGLGIGVGQHGLPFDEALHNYTLLTIGDGLVAQIPSLLLSVSAAIMVTRVSGAKTLGDQVRDEMFTEPRALAVTAGLLGILGCIPGMPHTAFVSLAVICAAGAWLMHRKRQAAPTVAQQAAVLVDGKKPEDANTAADLGWDDVQPVDMLGLEVGYRLISLVDKSMGGDLLSRIKGVRKKLSSELGFLVPTVHIRDNLELLPLGYRITLMGVSVGEAEVQPERMLAINPGEVFGRIDGTETIDPAFGLPAVWIASADRDRAQSLGYTVVDPSTVIATHLNHIMQRHADELLGHDEAQALLERLRGAAPKLADALVPGTLSLGIWLRVLQNLLREQVPIRDLRTIAESVIDASATHKDPDKLTAAARIALGRMIVQSIYGSADDLSVLTLDAELEQLLTRSQMQGANGSGVEPGLLDRLQRSLMAAAEQQEVAGRPAVLVVNDSIRGLLARFVRYGKKTLHVLSFAELPDNKQISVVATIGANAT